MSSVSKFYTSYSLQQVVQGLCSAGVTRGRGKASSLVGLWKREYLAVLGTQDTFMHVFLHRISMGNCALSYKEES